MFSFQFIISFRKKKKNCITCVMISVKKEIKKNGYVHVILATNMVIIKAVFIQFAYPAGR